MKMISKSEKDLIEVLLIENKREKSIVFNSIRNKVKGPTIAVLLNVC